MLRPFCDICGEPAYTGTQGYAERRENARWSGKKYGECTVTEGTWTPIVGISLDLSIENIREADQKSRTPDLCKVCLLGYIQLLVEKISECKSA